MSVLLAADVGYADPGPTDATGGHAHRQTGEYHTHGERPARPSAAIPVDTPPAVRENTAIPPFSKPSTLKFAAWNIRSFSDRSRDATELRQIAQVLIDYDLIAMLEVRDENVLKRLQRLLSASGAEYGYLMSDPVGQAGSPYTERYAFLYYKGLVTVVTDGALYPDAADGSDDFVRDPYWATFRAGRFDFSVIASHVVWGDRVAKRQAELMALADVYRYVQHANGAEDDVLLVGDFNREPSDTRAYSALMAIPSMTHLFRLPQKSHIRDSSLYDNIFFQTDAVTEYLGRSGIDKFDETDFGNNDTAASLAVSDHRPVWAVFSLKGDDAGSNTGGHASVWGRSPNITDSASIEPAPQLTETITVYVTRTGKKYHLGNCSSLRRSKIPISLVEAQQRYGACSRCNPPRD